MIPESPHHELPLFMRITRESGLPWGFDHKTITESGQHLVDDVAVNVGEAEVAALEAVIQLGVVEPQ